MEVDYQSLLTNIREGVYFTDLERRITYWNPGAERISGFSAQEVIGRRCADNILIHVDDRGRSLCRGLCPLAATMKDARPREARVFLHHKQGHRVPVDVRVTPLRDSAGKVVGGAEFFSDASNQETMTQRIQELEQLALLDSLTQLPNRNHIEPELVSRFHEMERLNLDFGLIFMDLDHFKQVNDTHGHDVGDQVLLTVAETLKASVRPFDLVGRWGGEEFVCIVRNADAQTLATVADRLLAAIGSSSVQAGDTTIPISASMGATLAYKSDTIDTLVKRADHLMYVSKHNGRNRVTYG